MKPFRPIGSVLINVTTSSVATALPGSVGGTQNATVRLYNAGPSNCFVALGGSGVTAAANGTSLIIQVGAIEVFQTHPGDTHIATIYAVSGSGAALYVSRGEGA